MCYCVNPHSLVESAADPAFRAALEHAEFLIADGVGVTLAARLRGARIPRITGSDLFEATCRIGAERKLRHFFLGAKNSTLDALCTRTRQRYPEVVIAGCYSPPFAPEFTEEQDLEMVGLINAVRPDVLWVGMTAPKQEKWIDRNRHRLDVRCAAAVGAVFDYYAGTVRRPGPAWRAAGLEWLPRLIREPKRLWRRTVLSAPQFMLMALKYELRTRRSR